MLALLSLMSLCLPLVFSYLSVLVYASSSVISSLLTTATFLSFAYTRIYSCLILKCLLSELPPPSLFSQTRLAKKLASPKISLHRSLNWACSLSSMLIKTRPVFFNKSFASTNRLTTNESHLLCRKVSSESTYLSLYLKSLLPVYYPRRLCQETRRIKGQTISLEYRT